MTELRSFTPSEAAKISGVNVALQRDWRRRGILPALESRSASFSAFEVAEMMALNALANRGGTLADYKGISGKLGAAIIQYALGERLAYNDAIDHSVDGNESDLRQLFDDYGWRFECALWMWRSTAPQSRAMAFAGYRG